MTYSSHVRPVPWWLHAWAVLTAVAATAPVALGSVVTTLQAGMADRDWPTAPWHLLLLRARDQVPFDFLVEHSHRAAAWMCGFTVLALAVGLWVAARRRSLAWFGTAALLGVAAQAALGGMRVLFDVQMGETLKAVHGFFAQVVFSLLVCVAVLTAPRRADAVLRGTYGATCRRAAAALTAAAVCQVAFGVLLRHTHTGLAQRLHVLTAFAVVAAVAWLAKTVFEHPAGRRALGRPVVVVAALTVVQLALGVEAWLGLYSSEMPAELVPVTASSAVLRTAHVLVGASLLAASVVAAMQAYRAGAPAPVEEQPEPTSAAASAPLMAATTNHVKGTV